MDVVIYTRTTCQSCHLAKADLNARRIPYTEIKLEEQITRDELLEKFPTAKKLPVVVIDGEYIGSREELTVRTMGVNNGT